MASEIVIKRLYDYELVCGTLDYLWADISEDGVERYTPDLLNEMWLGLFLDNEYLGMYRFHSHSSVLLEGHVFMLPEKREHSLICGHAIMKWLCENTNFNRVIVHIPECFTNVISFAEKLGLVEQGYSPDSFKKNGDLIGLYEYGISRGEMKW